MNFLRKFANISKRSIHSTSLLRNSLISENLSNHRSLIRVQGNEVIPFLQGLITNDMKHFERGSDSIYAMFLNKSGRILHESIIYKTSENDTFIIETDKKGSNDLCRHLRLFRVRRKIDIDNLDSDYSLWVLFQNYKENNDNTEDIFKINITKNDLKIENLNINEILICIDPRVKFLGTRLILPKSLDNKSLSEIFKSENIKRSTLDNDYKLHRYKLGVSEGIDEHQYNKILPFETNIDYLHGISFHKGCYLGQELTARTYHTGVIRKRIMPIKLTKPLNETNDSNSKEIQTPNGNVCGIIRGTKDLYCIAVMRIEKALQAQSLFINGESCTLIIPHWWPKELPNKMKLKEKQL